MTTTKGKEGHKLPKDKEMQKNQRKTTKRGNDTKEIQAKVRDKGPKYIVIYYRKCPRNE